MISSTFQQRLQDLVDHIDQDFQLLKEFEDSLRYETNPRIKAAYRQDIKQLRESAIIYQKEYDEIYKIINNEQSDKNTKNNVEMQLHHIYSKLDILLNAQNDFSEEIYLMRQMLLNRYDDTEKNLISSIVEQFNQTKFSITQTLLDALETNQFSDLEMQQMLAVLQKQIPSLPTHQTAIAEIIKAPELDTKHKLKITLPIVPFLIDYEGELEIGSGFNIKVVWESLLVKLRKK